jgi:hypothetical protein
VLLTNLNPIRERNSDCEVTFLFCLNPRSLSFPQPGGQDSQLVLPDTLHTYVSTNYLLRSDDEVPAYITVQTNGWRKGPREVMQRLFDPEQADGVDPNEYSFRLSIKLETGDERYAEIVNSGMWIGSGMRKGSEGEFYYLFLWHVLGGVGLLLCDWLID